MLSGGVAITIFYIACFRAVGRGLDDVSNNRLTLGRKGKVIPPKWYKGHPPPPPPHTHTPHPTHEFSICWSILKRSILPSEESL